MQANKNLVVENLNLSYGSGSDERRILQDICFTVASGELVSIVGESGCGKSSLLRAIAGIHTAYAGDVRFDDKEIRITDPLVGFMFQQAKLFDWLNVEENIGYGLKINGVDRDTRHDKVHRFIEEIGLSGYHNYYPSELSGGMQQRVSLARSLIMEPELILMDEPFSALDFKTRREMQELTIRLWEKYKPSIVFVTHDIEEAILLSDRILLMEAQPGRIVKQIPVPFSRPRPLEITATVAFSEIKKDVLQLFMGV